MERMRALESPPRQVGPPHRAAEQHVADDREALGRRHQDHAARGVAGAVQHVEGHLAHA
jgi:hypothetical protein